MIANVWEAPGTGPHPPLPMPLPGEGPKWPLRGLWASSKV